MIDADPAPKSDRTRALPLAGVRVLDFSTLLPGPLATLILAEAGAEVVKVERPLGEDLRAYRPRLGDDSAHFHLLNAGKRSVALDLKAPGAVALLRPLIERADVLVEQFRPGVMARFGLAYDDVRAINPRLVYCSINGFGSTGARADVAAHDLNYVAATGLLGLVTAADGTPSLPHALVADIGGGALPAVINILLALRERDATGMGRRIEVVMSENAFTFAPWALLGCALTGGSPQPNADRLQGGSARYHVYRTADARYLAAAPLEQRFWDAFCEAIELPEALRDDARDPAATTRGVAAIVATQSADAWMARFAGRDVCCSIVLDVAEAAADPGFAERGVFAHAIEAGDRVLPALPLPLDRAYRGAPSTKRAPALGEANALLGAVESAALPRRGLE